MSHKKNIDIQQYIANLLRIAVNPYISFLIRITTVNYFDIWVEIADGRLGGSIYI